MSFFLQSTLDNASPFEAIQLVGENNMTYRVTLSEAIKDPIMAVTTLGSGSAPATYDFNAPFTILSQGVTCCWGGGRSIDAIRQFFDRTQGCGNHPVSRDLLDLFADHAK